MDSQPVTQFVSVSFTRFKAFKSFSVTLRHFNILVGPNNAGKSTILAAFRILASAIRRASSRKAMPVKGPYGHTLGYEVDLGQISVAEENIFYNYDGSEGASIVFSLSNKNSLTLHFDETGSCVLIPDAQGKHFSSPSNFRKNFNCPIGFVPILGPVEHQETLYEKEAARLALFNYKAARNFRNIWYHYPDKFEEFRAALLSTWPGMDIQKPEVSFDFGKPKLHMYCPENRIPREIFWAGFGFQVWCQMLTHLIQNNNVSIFLIDEPDIYLHSELQRLLFGLLKNLGPDVIMATHSTEIVTEAEPDEMLLINKEHHKARRIKNVNQVASIFETLGSNINPILTQLAKTKKVVFVEGKDFQIISKFANKLGETSIGSRRGFAVVAVDGFNPEKIKNLKSGIETTLGSKVHCAAILDRDFRCSEECAAVIADCQNFCEMAVVHKSKEIESFLLVPDALDRAISQRVKDRARRVGGGINCVPLAADVLEQYSLSVKTHIMSQFIFSRKQFIKKTNAPSHETDVLAEAIKIFSADWEVSASRLAMLPAKEAFSAVNKAAQEKYQISVTQTAVIAAMGADEIPDEMRKLIAALVRFSVIN